MIMPTLSVSECGGRPLTVMPLRNSWHAVFHPPRRLRVRGEVCSRVALQARGQYLVDLLSSGVCGRENCAVRHACHVCHVCQFVRSSRQVRKDAVEELADTVSAHGPRPV
jgi:hypothetical protein